MRILHKTYLSTQGRTVVKFGCYRDTTVAAYVEVSQFVHLEHDIVGAVYDAATGHYVAHYVDHNVGDYDDWVVAPIVELAARDLGILVPKDLWWTPSEPPGAICEGFSCSDTPASATR